MTQDGKNNKAKVISATGSPLPQQGLETPTVRPGGLVTVAFLKAQLDTGSDHLGIFMPLVLEAVTQSEGQSVIAAEVQNSIADCHGIAMPQQTVDTLLKRAARKGWLTREFGRFFRADLPAVPDIPKQKSVIYEAQGNLARGLVAHAQKRGLQVDEEGALQMLLRFLEEQQIGLLLGTPMQGQTLPTTAKERAVIAEFVEFVVKADAALSAALNAILEGLVLYRAAFLPDLQSGSGRFVNLNVYFDSGLVRQALGYEGAAMQALARDTLAVLKAEEARCLVFDKTVAEISRILDYFEHHIGTSEGRLTMRPTAMARHFLVRRYGVSDIREMQALLRDDIEREGYTIVSTPARDPRFVGDEAALAKMLEDPQVKDAGSQRIQHDVDCIAAVKTIRGGRTTERLDDCRAIFASASVGVIRQGQSWYHIHEGEAGIEPIVHIRAITNLAWLRRPTLRAQFKVHELIALCAAAMRPSLESWNRFLKQLDVLQKSQKITSEETALVLVSRMSDQLLREAELDSDGDIDAAVLDDVVERVKSSYVEKYEQELADQKRRADRELSAVNVSLTKMQEENLARDVFTRRRAQRTARAIGLSLQWLLIAALTCGGAALFLEYHNLIGGIVGGFIVACVVAFIVLEYVGHFERVTRWRRAIESRLASRIESWLSSSP